MAIIDFKMLEKQDKKILDPFFKRGYYENGHLNFTNLYMWRKPHRIMWTVEEDVLYMKAEWEGRSFVMQPIGPQEKMATAITRYLEWFQKEGKPFYIYGVERAFMEQLKAYPAANFAFEDDRDNYDYVYRSEDLIHLAGRKYHSKKNHLNSFHKNFPQAEYLPITGDIVEACKENLDQWYAAHIALQPEDPFLAVERDSVKEILDDFSYFQLRGGAIRIDGRIVAFTFGEALNSDTVVVHIEKADPDVRGAYPAINQAFIEKEWSEMTYVNREEDMGIEGMRRAKESYKPVKMIEKFNATLKN